MKRVVLAILGLGIGTGLAWWLVNMPVPKNPRFDPTDEDLKIPHLTTRGSFVDGKRMVVGPLNPEVVGIVPGLSKDAPCGAEVMIVVHGFNNSPKKALNRFGVARQSLQAAGYQGAVIGFSWDADTQHDSFSMTGYHLGRDQAVANGAALARSIEAIKAACPELKVRLIGYSMGARLALESLLALKAGVRVDSVHLVGAAMDNEEVELGERYGAAIERAAGHVVNYFSPDDSKLGLFFWVKEGDRALGKSDIEHPDRQPKNYESRNSVRELPEIEDDGSVKKGGKAGGNHSGYLGTRNREGKLTDDGVMDVIVRDIGQFK